MPTPLIIIINPVIVHTKKNATLSATRKGGLGKKKRIGIGKFKPQGKSPEGVTQIKGKTKNNQRKTKKKPKKN